MLLLPYHSLLTNGVRRNHGSHFEKAKTAFEEGAANDEPADDVVDQEKHSSDNESGNEKGAVIREEKA